MAILRGVLPGMLLAGAVVAQQQVQVFNVADVITNVERFTGEDPQLRTHFSVLLTHAFDEGPKVQLEMPRGRGAAPDRVVVVGTLEQIKEVRVLLDQLRRQDLQELRVQCTQVTMPLQTAAAAGLAAGKVVEVDEGRAGKVFKDAVAAKGTLHNLPEAGVLPLQPCVMIQPRREGKAETEPFARSEVRVQVLPLGDDEAWFALKWRGETQGAAGAVQSAAAGAEPKFEAAMRLKAGKGAMVMSVQGQHAVVLWVRFCFTRPAEPAHEKPQGKGG
jgi:hypothetical protein